MSLICFFDDMHVFLKKHDKTFHCKSRNDRRASFKRDIESFQERENDHFTYIFKKTSNFKVYRRQNQQKVALKSIVPSRICRAYVVFL